MLTTWHLKFTHLKIFTENGQETAPGETLCDSVLTVLSPHYGTKTLTVIRHSSQVVELSGACSTTTKKRRSLQEESKDIYWSYYKLEEFIGCQMFVHVQIM